MPTFNRSVWFGGLLSALLLSAVMSGCDVPTSAPSLATETSLEAPLLAEKTFAFLGGPKSTHDPLIDTTRAGLASLFATNNPEQTVYVEQKLEGLGRGTLDGALAKAARGVRIDTSFAGPILQDNAIATQTVEATYERTNGTFESPGRVETRPLPPAAGASEVTVPFPTSSVFDPPQTEIVDATGATVESVTLTEAENELTLTLTNTRHTTAPLTNGSPGTAPEIAIRNASGLDPLPFTSMGNTPLPPGKSRTIVVDVSGERLGTESSIVLRVAGSGRQDELTIDTRPRLRYDTVTLSDPNAIRIQASATGLKTPTQSASRFAGLHVEAGRLQVRVENGFSFPLAIDRLALENAADARALLPRDFPSLNASLSEGTSVHVPGGASATHPFRLSGSGVARRVDATLKGRPAQSSGTVTLRATDGLRTVAHGTAAISKMHFWPAGERLRTAGTLPLSRDRVSFEQSGDFVEIAASTVRLQHLTNELGVGFDAFTLSYPDIRLPDANDDGRRYAPGDSLTLSLVTDPNGPFEFAPLRRSEDRQLETSIPSLRLFPTNHALPFHLHATMEAVPDTTKEHLRTLRVDEDLRADLTIAPFEVQALRGTVRPFTVNVTPDPDDDDRLDVADDAEARVASLQGLQDIAQRIEGLQLSGGSLTLSVTTDLGAKTRLYGALMGRTSNGVQFLAGKGPQRVAASDPMGHTFERSGTPLGAENLMQFDVEGGSGGHSVTRSVTLTDENSTVNSFISQLPTHLRFAGQSRVSGGRLHLQSPVQFDVGLGLRVPLSFKDRFSYRDTLDADLSGLDALTDPSQRVTISSAQLQITYANTIPVGFDATVQVVGREGDALVSLPSNGAPLTLKPAPKTNDGTTAAPRNGTLTLDLSEDEVRSLAHGHTLRLQLTMDQQDQGPPPRIRADDTVRLSFSTDIEASVRAGG